MNHWGWANSWNQTSGITAYWPTLTTSSGSNAQPYYIQSQQLAPVLESPSARLGDREWLDAQIAEVCTLAEAA